MVGIVPGVYEGGMVGIVPPCMPVGVPLVGIHPPYHAAPLPPWVHHRPHSRRRLQCRCISGIRVRDSKALGSTLRLIWTMRRIMLSFLSKV